MMKKLLTIFATVFSLFACNNDEDVKSLYFEGSDFSVVGRWYAENNADNPIFNMYGEYVFTADGTIYIDEYRGINGYRRNELRGVFSINGNSITTGFDFNEGGQSTSSLKVTEGLTFSASFHRFSEDYTLTFLRIVGEIALMVGDTLNVAIEAQKNIEAYTSKPIEIKSYSMNDDAIASVNDDGLLTAKLIGTSYLKVETSVGTAILKVSVSDKENLWNDFSKVLGKDFYGVELILGKYHIIDNKGFIHYYYDNPYIDSVIIYRHDNIADSIVVSFQSQAEEKDIMNYLEKKLNRVDSLSCWFTDNDNYMFSTFSVRYHTKEKELIYTYLEPVWNDRMSDYGLVFDELCNKYGNYSNKAKDNSWIEFSNTKNDFVDYIRYYLNPIVTKYEIWIHRDNIDRAMLNDYLNRNFKYLNVEYPYAKNVKVNGKELLVKIFIDSNNYRRIVYIFDDNG